MYDHTARAVAYICGRLAAGEHNSSVYENNASVDADTANALKLLAKLPTIVALDQRRRHGQKPMPPNRELGFAENFFHMCFGHVPDPEVVRCFEISLVLYAEHSFNASTFAAPS